jgi:hypothetical protein
MAATAVVAAACSITGISVNNDCFDYDVSGTLTLDASQTGTITLEVYAKEKGTSTWDATGAEVIVATIRTTLSYPYQIVGIPTAYFVTSGATPPAKNYASLRIEIVGSTGAISWAGTTTKSGSYGACTPVIVPESPLAVGLPIAGIALFAGAFATVAIRRRRNVTQDV